MSTQLLSVSSLGYALYILHSFLNILAFASSTQVPLTAPLTLPLIMSKLTVNKGACPDVHLSPLK